MATSKRQAIILFSQPRGCCIREGALEGRMLQCLLNYVISVLCLIFSTNVFLIHKDYEDDHLVVFAPFLFSEQAHLY